MEKEESPLQEESQAGKSVNDRKVDLTEMAETTHQFFGTTNSKTKEEQFAKPTLGISECGAVCAGNFEDFGLEDFLDNVHSDIGSLEIAGSGEKCPLGSHSESHFSSHFDVEGHSTGPRSGFHLDTGVASVPHLKSQSDMEEDSSVIPQSASLPGAPRIVGYILKNNPKDSNQKVSEIQKWDLDFQTLRSDFRNPSARNFTENLAYRTRRENQVVNHRLDDFGGHLKDQKTPIDASVLENSWVRFHEACDLLEFSKTLVDDKK